MTFAWKKTSHSYSEPASHVVRHLARSLRSRGTKARDALTDLGPALGITPRRARTLFYADGEPVVLVDEWTRIRAAAAGMLRREAELLRESAAEQEARAIELERQQQLDLGDEWASLSGYACLRGGDD